MSRLVFRWPDEACETVRAARGRLEVAGEQLASRGFEERLGAVARVVERWCAADSPWRRALIESLSDELPFHRATLDEGLESALRAWDVAAFEACARRELTNENGRRRLAPYRCTSVLAGGSIPMPTLLSGLLPLVLGSPVLLRETSIDSVTAGLLARSIRESDRELGDCFEVVRFAVEDVAAMQSFLESPCVVATGSDATVSGIAQRLEPEQRFVAYGHRFSIAVLGPACTRTSVELERVAAGLALDVARWDQMGCLSPVVVYLVDLAPSAAKQVAERVAAALESLSASMPRGEAPTEILAAHAAERAEARMRAAVEDDSIFFEGEDFAVSLAADARPRPAPLARYLNLLPVESPEALRRALEPFAPHLSNAAVAGFERPEAAAIARLMTQLGVSRVCEPGRLQTPPVDWPHDGMPLFTPMARFVHWDRYPLGSD